MHTREKQADAGLYAHGLTHDSLPDVCGEWSVGLEEEKGEDKENEHLHKE